MPFPSPWNFSAYEPEIISSAWEAGQPVLGNDAALWRKDEFGAWINRLEYGSRNSEFGWEIFDPSLASASVVYVLRPMQWQNYLDQIAFEGASRTTADGLRNTRKLL